MKRKLEDLIAIFLSERVKILGGNERGVADPKDVEMLDRIVRELVASKWQASYDGWVPVEVTLVNRTTHEPLYYAPMPYDVEEEKQLNFEEQMYIATSNMRRASEQLSNVWRTQESKLRRERAVAAKRYCWMHGEYKKSGPCERCAEEKAKRG